MWRTAHCILCSENVLGENPKASYRHSVGYQAGLFCGELNDRHMQLLVGVVDSRA